MVLIMFVLLWNLCPAQSPTIVVEGDQPRARVSADLHGIFFEEISHGGEGGLYAELIQNQPVPFNVDIKEGDRLLASWHPARPRVWEVVEVGPFDWKTGEPLVLSAYGPYPPGEVNGAVLDRVEMEWR